MIYIAVDVTGAVVQKPNWFSTDFKACINLYGIDYLDQWNTSELNRELLKSNKNVNEASLKNYESQRSFSIATIGIALLAAIFSVLDYTKPEPKMVELNNNIRLISKELANLKIQMNKIENQKASAGDSSRKH